MADQQSTCKTDVSLDDAPQKSDRTAATRKTKWVPLPAELTSFRSARSSPSASSSSSSRKRARRRRKEQKKEEEEEDRPQKPTSPSLASTCSSSSSGIGSFSSGSVARLRAESTDALETASPSSACSIVDDEPPISDLILERECEQTAVSSNSPVPSAVGQLGPNGEIEWENPALKQFYEEQRAMYRRIYDQHFASLWMATNADFAQHSLAAHFHEQCDVRGRRTNRSGSQPDGHSAVPSGRRPLTAGGRNRTTRHRIPRPMYGRTPDVYKHTLERLDPLSGEIYAFQKTIEQTPKSLCEKLYLRDLLFNAIHPKYPGSGLYVVGSTLNGFGSSASDMDLCLMITNQELDQRVDAIIHLTRVMGILRDHSWVKDLDVIFAKVPILRATFHAPFENIVVDLNANNSVAIRNTHLLAYYSGYDWRVRPLVCAVKAWAKQRGINNASQSSLTSYSLVLMVIHYLQGGVEQPVLPSLQEHYKEQFSPTRDIRQLEFSEPLKPIRGWEGGRSNAKLGELLIGFFEYYAKTFDFDHQAISVRRGRAVRRADVVTNNSPHNSLSQWRCICIEEPMLSTNTAHAVYDERVFQCIKKSFEDASNTLKTKKTLEALLNVEPIDMLSGL